MNGTKIPNRKLLRKVKRPASTWRKFFKFLATRENILQARDHHGQWAKFSLTIEVVIYSSITISKAVCQSELYEASSRHVDVRVSDKHHGNATADAVN